MLGNHLGMLISHLEKWCRGFTGKKRKRQFSSTRACWKSAEHANFAPETMHFPISSVSIKRAHWDPIVEKIFVQFQFESVRGSWVEGWGWEPRTGLGRILSAGSRHRFCVFAFLHFCVFAKRNPTTLACQSHLSSPHHHSWTVQDEQKPGVQGSSNL